MPKRDFHQRALPSGRNWIGGFFYRGKLSNPDKVLYNIAGKALGLSTGVMVKYMYVRTCNNTVLRLWQFLQHRMPEPLPKDRTLRQPHQSKLCCWCVLYIGVYVV